jgi:prevent-host-death family protein
MREIGVRELKANLSRVLRQVESGEQVRVTVRGRPVADLVPVGGVQRYSPKMRQLIAEGRVTPASQPLPLPKAPPPIKTGKSASALILAEREEER